MDLFFNVDGVGTEIGLAETAGCVVRVELTPPPSADVAGVVVLVVVVVVAVVAVVVATVNLY